MINDLPGSVTGTGLVAQGPPVILRGACGPFLVRRLVAGLRGFDPRRIIRERMRSLYFEAMGAAGILRQPTLCGGEVSTVHDRRKAWFALRNLLCTVQVPSIRVLGGNRGAAPSVQGTPSPDSSDASGDRAIQATVAGRIGAQRRRRAVPCDAPRRGQNARSVAHRSPHGLFSAHPRRPFGAIAAPPTPAKASDHAQDTRSSHR